MRLSGDLIFYWIKKRWSKAIHIKPEKCDRALITRPMFWGSIQEMRGHLVVINRKQMLQIDRHYPSTIFLVLDCSLAKKPHRDNEFILLPGENRYDKVFNRLCAIVELFESWDENLDKALNSFYSYEAIIRSCDGIVDRPIALLDKNFRYVAYSKRHAVKRGFEKKYVDHNYQLTLEAINSLTAQPDFVSLETENDVFRWTAVESTLNLNIYSDGTYIARLVCPLSENEENNNYYVAILLIIKHYIDELYSKLHSFFQKPVTYTRFSRLICGLMDGMMPPRETIAFQTSALGFEKGDLYYLVQVKPHAQNGTNRLSSVLTSQIDNLWSEGVCFMKDDKCYLLINITRHSAHESQPFCQELAVFLRESLMVAGLSRRFSDLYEIPCAARQTDIAFEMGSQRDPMYWYYKFDDYAFAYIVLQGMQEFQPHQICAQPLFDLMKYDLENSTNLNETLHTFIELRYNAVASAKKLFVARSSFLKRLDRIHELTGIDLDDYETRIYLALSYQIMKYYQEEISS